MIVKVMIMMKKWLVTDVSHEINFLKMILNDSIRHAQNVPWVGDIS